MDLAAKLADYALRALALVFTWPVAILIVAFWFRKPLIALLDRLQFAKFPGFEVRMTIVMKPLVRRTLGLVAGLLTASTNCFAQGDRSGYKPSACIDRAYADYDKAKREVEKASGPIESSEALILKRRLQENLCETVRGCVIQQIGPQPSSVTSSVFSSCIERETLRDYSAVRRP